MPLGPIHCGSLLLLVATVLLLVTSISTPVIHNISFLDIKSGNSKATFGVFGYCSNIIGKDQCSSRHLGYDIARVTGTLTNHSYINKSLDGATKALVLHPIATAIAFLSFLIAIGSDHIGYLCAALVAFVAFLVSLVAMALDFAIFGIIRHEINSNTSASASFSAAIWLTLAATIILFFSTFIVCFSCCTNRRRVRDREYAPPMTQTSGYQKRRWWKRGTY
ncbi:uncharacterized protein L203_102797 [Cryptococcus depauperatus CBS 7841]|uniref:Uncharacterized protein n=1 Tax=Cryptococcus depauperatus CBS 7841 TaxID=1295531 RepID=A0A1E3IBD2_9TREE|nr:hypothetical protein L203_04599 [Cryptococcus depauperatus CBS 7841]